MFPVAMGIAVHQFLHVGVVVFLLLIMEGEGVQEVVMERDGKFEVLSAVDLQVEQVEESHTDQVEVTGAAIANQEEQTAHQIYIQHSALQEDQQTVPGRVGDTEGAVLNTEPFQDTETVMSSQQVCSPSKEERKHALDEVKNEGVEQSQPSHMKTNTTVLEKGGPNSEVTVKSSSQTIFDTVMSTQQTGNTYKGASMATNSHKTVDRRKNGGVEDSQPSVGSKGEVQSIRTQSAPGSRSTRLAAHREEEEREKRKRLSDAAFSAWLARKNDEVIERRKRERVKQSSMADNERKTKEMCDVVYQNWLEAKNKQWQSQRAREAMSRPSTSVPKRDEEYCRQAFESWMKKKRTQHLEEIKKERIKSQEMEEAAKIANPSVIDKAYEE